MKIKCFSNLNSFFSLFFKLSVAKPDRIVIGITSVTIKTVFEPFNQQPGCQQATVA